MAWKIKITASARADIKNIKKWYRTKSLQAVENLANELIAGIESLQKDTVEYKTVHGNYKRFLLDKFPYTIYYQRKEKEGIVEINAVLHNRRDGDVVSRRLYE